MGGFKTTLKAFVSFNRDNGLTELELKFQVSVSKTSLQGCSRFFSNLTSCHSSLLEWECIPFRDELNSMQGHVIDLLSLMTESTGSQAAKITKSLYIFTRKLIPAFALKDFSK